MGKMAELVYDGKAMLGEGPCWDAENGLLYWLDLVGKKLNVLDIEKQINKEIALKQTLGCAVLRESGGIMLTMQSGFYFMDGLDGKLTQITDPEENMPQNRFNDGKCDTMGRLWAGTMCDKQTEVSGSLYFMDADMKVHKKLGNIGISNGIAWSPDNRIMYFIDTPTRKVDAFDYDIETGNIKNRRTVVSMPSNHGAPDGMNIDVEGMLWVCEWGGSKVSRWNPHNGELIDEIEVPATYVTSCTFGGKDMDELFITTARNELSEEEYKKQPFAGGIFRFKAGVRGPESYKFTTKQKI